MFNNVKGKQAILAIIFSFLLLITIICICLYKSDEENRDIDYKKIFYENKNQLDKVAIKLLSLDIKYLQIFEDDEELLAYDDGELIDLSGVLGQNTINDINDILKMVKLEYIGKINEYVEFKFYSKKDQISLAYTPNKSKLGGYSDIEDLDGNWYYCYIAPWEE